MGCSIRVCTRHIRTDVWVFLNGGSMTEVPVELMHVNSVFKAQLWALDRHLLNGRRDFMLLPEIPIRYRVHG